MLYSFDVIFVMYIDVLQNRPLLRSLGLLFVDVSTNRMLLRSKDLLPNGCCYKYDTAIELCLTVA